MSILAMVWAFGWFFWFQVAVWASDDGQLMRRPNGQFMTKKATRKARRKRARLMSAFWPMLFPMFACMLTAATLTSISTKAKQLKRERREADDKIWTVNQFRVALAGSQSAQAEYRRKSAMREEVKMLANIATVHDMWSTLPTLRALEEMWNEEVDGEALNEYTNVEKIERELKAEVVRYTPLAVIAWPPGQSR